MVMPNCMVTRFERTALPTKHSTAASGPETQLPCARDGGAAETSNRHTPARTIFFRFIFANSSVWNASGAVQRGLGPWRARWLTTFHLLPSRAQARVVPTVRVDRLRPVRQASARRY